MPTLGTHEDPLAFVSTFGRAAFALVEGGRVSKINKPYTQLGHQRRERGKKDVFVIIAIDFTLKRQSALFTKILPIRWQKSSQQLRAPNFPT